MALGLLFDFQCFSMSSMLPFMKIKFSKFSAVRLDRFALNTSDAVLKSLSTAAELGSEVLYLRNKLIQTFLWSSENISGPAGNDELFVFQKQEQHVNIVKRKTSKNNKQTKTSKRKRTLVYCIRLTV